MYMTRTEMADTWYKCRRYPEAYYHAATFANFAKVAPPPFEYFPLPCER
jgi:hypothetical protein